MEVHDDLDGQHGEARLPGGTLYGLAGLDVGATLCYHGGLVTQEGRPTPTPRLPERGAL